jgi:hypothetical protein
VCVASGQKLTRLLCRLGLNAPLLDAGHDHVGGNNLNFPLVVAGSASCLSCFPKAMTVA